MLWGIYPTINGSIIVFYLPPRTSPKVHKQFRKKIYGEDTSSWKGRYQYRRKGILDTVRHVKLYKGVVIVLPEDVSILVETLTKNGAMIHMRKVELTAEDRKMLKM